ncbi:hypothetical protein [Nitrososphaera sp.]|uniref:hypothetical protein n=1 Tax=Nitrososphaera sp. TaxID=1971748 RepID=UPI00307D4882
MSSSNNNASVSGGKKRKDDEIAGMLDELHAHYLKGNEYDEGDPIFYRINYRLAETFALGKEEAEKYHAQYHSARPRRVSEGFCDYCGKVVTIIPIIYGVQESDMARMEAAQAEGRLIIGDMEKVRHGGKVAMFGCRVCKGALEKYGTI